MATGVASSRDREYLLRALELAERGRGRVSPNPLVGAVIVRDGEPIGEGWHAELGGAHAEVSAIEEARRRGADTAGATLYVTLEPCAHRGRTPPCTEAILEAGLARVVIASEDPSDKAAGRGPKMLRRAGVDVSMSGGDVAGAARRLNQPFRKHALTGLPHVILKCAISLDGRVATRSGDSRWISGAASRELVHRWRGELDAVCVGIGTALADDPLLTARGGPPPAVRQPTRVVFDSAARLPTGSQLVRSAADAELVVIASSRAPRERLAALTGEGVETVVCDGEGAERLRSALAALGRRPITSLLLEGGPELAGAFLDAGEIDELRLFVAPIVIGGRDARPMLGGSGAERVEEALRAVTLDGERCGEDLLIRARLREW